MKKTYETPSIEVVAFQYRDQVVAASGTCYVTSEVVSGTSQCNPNSAPTYTKD